MPSQLLDAPSADAARSSQLEPALGGAGQDEQELDSAGESSSRDTRSDATEEKELIYEAFSKSRLNLKNIDWIVLGWIAGVHLGCLAAPFFFSWTALGVAIAAHWLTCSIGICLGYHRFLSHRSFKLKGPVRFFTLACGALSGEGSPLMWAAVHRLHHARSDQDGDPHSPLEGTFWSHMLWLFAKHDRKLREKMFQRYVPDLINDPMLQFFERTYFLWMVGSAALAYAIGGLPFLVWAVCVRMVVAYHSTWFVNSATHLWGYRNYNTTDESRNLWWVAVLSYGEGWHNNHHAHPSVARAGHRWWEFDPTWLVIKTLRAFRLATHVNDRVPKSDKHSA